MPEDDPSYGALRDQIEGLLTEGRLERRRAGEWRKVETCWHVGDALAAHLRARPGVSHRADDP